MIEVAIDPGLAGAIVVKAGGIHSKDAPRCYRTPVRDRPYGKGREIDVDGLHEIFGPLAQCDEVVVTLEQPMVMPKQSSQSGLTTGSNWGIIYGFLLTLRLKPLVVHPRVWKTKMGLGGDKALAISKAKEVWPGIELVFPRCTVEHDGAAEASLLIQWRREHGSSQSTRR